MAKRTFKKENGVSVQVFIKKRKKKKATPKIQQFYWAQQTWTTFVTF